MVEVTMIAGESCEDSQRRLLCGDRQGDDNLIMMLNDVKKL